VTAAKDNSRFLCATRTKSTDVTVAKKELKIQFNISICADLWYFPKKAGVQMSRQTQTMCDMKAISKCQHTASSKSTSVFLSVSFFWSLSPPPALTPTNNTSLVTCTAPEMIPVFSTPTLNDPKVIFGTEWRTVLFTTRWAQWRADVFSEAPHKMFFSRPNE